MAGSFKEGYFGRRKGERGNILNMSNYFQKPKPKLWYHIKKSLVLYKNKIKSK